MADYRSTLTGTQMDSALLDMAEHNSEAYAVGERNGIAVASDDVTYHNNARYYAQIASSQIVGDASSAVRWDTDQSEALTSAQKAQARENINAASDSDVVKITSQTLTSAEQEQARANIMAGGSNRNLLDNAYFVGGGSQLGDGVFPINQRGQTSYGNGQTFDRWKLSAGGTVTLTQNGITFNGLLFQKKALDLVVGETYTLSCQTQNGEVVSLTGVVPSTEGWMIGGETFGIYFQPSTKVCDIQIWGDYSLRAMKLEKGSISTLANDAPPDYWQELDKCLYYFERITNNGSSPITIGAGFADGVNNLYAPVRIHRKRADISTISTSGAIYAGQRSLNISVSSVSQYNSTPDGIITLLATTSSAFTSNEYYRLALGAGAHIDFSADL